MTNKIVPDTSALIDGEVSKLVDEGELEDVEVVIPEFVVDELENQANKGMEVGYKGIEELEQFQELDNITVSFTGRKPTTEEIKMASNGRIDALIRDVAEEMDATLFTGDYVQYRLAEAKGVDVRFFETEDDLKFSLEDYFDDKTMSVHLKEGDVPRAKKGLPGEFELEQIGENVIEREEIEDLISETIENAEMSDEGLIEMEGNGATVVQIGKYRIAITRPPFSEKAEITAVRPVAKVGLEDYDLSDELMDRLDEKAEGILIAGAPGHGKSTFAQALAEHYEAKNKVVKTMEKPRDLDVGERITQYSELDGSMENTGDFLLLARPDYTIYDEVRKTRDFEVFSDLRLAGVGMIGVVHASKAVDAVQRLIGRVELGMIPEVCDTVIHIQNAGVEKVYKIELTVKVPEGMTEEDLARPVIQISRFENDKPEYEIYTYGEETVVVPIEESSVETGAQRLARDQIKHRLKKHVKNPEIEFISDDHIRLLIDEGNIPQIIGQGGERIDEIEDELGLSITVEPRGASNKENIDYDIDERGNSVVLELGEEYASQDVDIFDGEEYLFTATVGKTGEVSLTKSSEVAGRILRSASDHNLEVKV
ncbi:PINc/VapC family ATPase [Candidatus Nanohalobium constans]|uniref:ATPase (PilT family) part of archaella system n=1 Tax=Candidatus Nanohalobium constans TaxID=2565781 RepID=A0A5Q0UGS0_9ARCH|nr:PINc/VapC family ATPase [Candidatus Nanohalobium constans]QGA80400.1 ATPase (PilT family) part of archaella system [Candidatus Nanohalobium constans]